MIGMRYPTEVNLVGDAAATLRALLPLLAGPTDRAWREKIEENVAALVGDHASAQAMVDANPVNPMRIVWELSRAPARTNAIVTADSGSVANWYARLPAHPRRRPRVAVGHARHDGRRGAVRDRRQVRPPGPAGDRAHR